MAGFVHLWITFSAVRPAPVQPGVMTQPQHPSDPFPDDLPAADLPLGPPPGNRPAGDFLADGDPAARPRVRLASPVSLLAVVPSLLGFHPSHRLVFLGVSG